MVASGPLTLQHRRVARGMTLAHASSTTEALPMIRPSLRVLPITLALLLAGSASLLSGQAAPATWRLTEQWRVDGTEQGGAGFAQVRDAVITTDRALWVLDFKEQAIRRYDARGRFLGASGRPGAGPGELRNANGLLRHGDGSVWVNDPSNGRLTVFGANGAFVRQHVLPSFGFGFRWEAWFDGARNEVVDGSTRKVGDDYRSVWRRVGGDGADRGVFEVPPCADRDLRLRGTPFWKAEAPNGTGSSGMYPFTTGGGYAFDGRGAVWCADASASRVALVRVASRDTMAVTSIALPRVPVAAAERDEWVTRIRGAVSRYPRHDFDAARIPATKPPIASLSIDDDGRLWVQHSDRYGTTRTTYDVHDARGAHLGRVTVPGRVPPHLPPRARGDALWLAVMDDDDVLQFAHFTIAR
jgi:hypothetical protein